MPSEVNIPENYHAEQEVLRKNYDEWYFGKENSEYDPSTREFFKKIIDLLNIKNGEKVIDIACGLGDFCHEVLRATPEVYGIDISNLAIDVAKKKYRDIRFFTGSAEELPFNSDFFDVVTCLGSLEHFRFKNVALKEIIRVAKPNARILFTLPNEFFLGHVYFVMKTGESIDEGEQSFAESFNTKLGWKKLLEDNGLKIISITKYNTIWASKKFSRPILYLYNYLIKYLLPFNLSYSFIYLCRK